MLNAVNTAVGCFPEGPFLATGEEGEPLMRGGPFSVLILPLTRCVTLGLHPLIWVLGIRSPASLGDFFFF